MKGAVTAERELAITGLREAGRGAGDGAGDRGIARTREGDVVHVRDNRRGVIERERTSVGLDGGRAPEGDGTAEGVRTEEITQGTIGGVARAGDR